MFETPNQKCKPITQTMTTKGWYVDGVPYEEFCGKREAAWATLVTLSAHLASVADPREDDECNERKAQIGTKEYDFGKKRSGSRWSTAEASALRAEWGKWERGEISIGDKRKQATYARFAEYAATSISELCGRSPKAVEFYVWRYLRGGVRKSDGNDDNNDDDDDDDDNDENDDDGSNIDIDPSARAPKRRRLSPPTPQTLNTRKQVNEVSFRAPATTTKTKTLTSTSKRRTSSPTQHHCHHCYHPVRIETEKRKKHGGVFTAETVVEARRGTAWYTCKVLMYDTITDQYNLHEYGGDKERTFRVASRAVRAARDGYIKSHHAIRLKPGDTVEALLYNAREQMYGWHRVMILTASMDKCPKRPQWIYKVCSCDASGGGGGGRGARAVVHTVTRADLRIPM